MSTITPDISGGFDNFAMPINEALAINNNSIVVDRGGRRRPDRDHRPGRHTTRDDEMHILPVEEDGS